MKMMLDEKVIDRIFERAESQAEYMAGLYRMVFPRWDEIKEVKGWPAVSADTWKAICRKCMDWDTKKVPHVMAGGAWLNQGFTSSGEPPLNLWEVDLSTCEVTFETKTDTVMEFAAARVIPVADLLLSDLRGLGGKREG